VIDKLMYFDYFGYCVQWYSYNESAIKVRSFHVMNFPICSLQRCFLPQLCAHILIAHSIFLSCR